MLPLPSLACKQTKVSGALPDQLGYTSFPIPHSDHVKKGPAPGTIQLLFFLRRVADSPGGSCPMMEALIAHSSG